MENMTLMDKINIQTTALLIAPFSNTNLKNISITKQRWNHILESGTGLHLQSFWLTGPSFYNYDTSLPHKPLSPKDHLRREMTVNMLGN